jgi:hypothetical protein
MISTFQRKDVKSSTSSYSPHSVLREKNDEMNSNNNHHHHIYPNNMIINSLDIADGLKELLIKYGFTLELLSTMSYSELAEILGINVYVAKIICNTARKLAATY